jgi:hypothetical protein
MINFEEKRVLVQSDQAESTMGKNMVVSIQLTTSMMMPRNPKASIWKENVSKKLHQS